MQMYYGKVYWGINNKKSEVYNNPELGEGHQEKGLKPKPGGCLKCWNSVAGMRGASLI